MKAAMVTPWEPRKAIGGQERIVCDLADGLEERHGAKVGIYSLSSSETAMLSKWGKLPALAALSMKKWDFGAYDLVHLHGWASEVFLGREKMPPMAVTMYGTIAQYLQNVKVSGFNRQYNMLTQMKYEKNTCRRAGYVVAICAKQKSEMVAHYGCPEEKIRVINCGIDSGLFVPKGRERSRERLGLPADKKIVLACGRMSVAHKGFDILLRLAAAADKDTLVVINGAVPDKLRAAMPPNMVARTTPLDEMPHLYSAADVLAHPSRYEGFGLVSAEAMACGTPAVAFDTGAAADLIGKNEAGRLVKDIRDEKGFVDSVLGLLSDEKGRAAAGKAGISRASGFGKGKMVDEYKRHYDEILSA